MVTEFLANTSVERHCYKRIALVVFLLGGLCFADLRPVPYIGVFKTLLTHMIPAL